MSYSTMYTLSVHRGKCNARVVAEFMRDMYMASGMFSAFAGEFDDFLSSENSRKRIFAGLRLENQNGCSWCDYEEDMRRLSKKFPDVVFKLHGEGEEYIDVWDMYFLNGKMQDCRAELFIPPFNEAEMD